MRAVVRNQKRAKDAARVPPLGLGQTAVLFGGAALLLFVATHGLIPALSGWTAMEDVLLWFAVAGLGVFVPLLLVGLVLLREETVIAVPGLWRKRLRFRPMTGTDWLWSVGALGLIGLLSVGTMAVLRALWGDVHLTPSFMTMDPLTPGRYWILGAWIPFWVLNIMGEEILWRGVVLPRQEIAFGPWAWLANGTGWLMFHLAFGAPIMLMLWPIVFILPYVVQRRRNSWIGVVIHAGLNGPGFVAAAFGFV